MEELHREFLLFFTQSLTKFDSIKKVNFMCRKQRKIPFMYVRGVKRPVTNHTHSMLKKNTLIVALIAALPVLAQEEVQPQQNPAPQTPHWGARGQMPNRKGRPDMHQRMLEKFDANKDGKLDETEMAARKAELGKHRAERGNRPARPEGAVHPGNRRRPHSERPEMLERFDDNKDGQLNEQEHKNLKDAGKKHREGRQEKSRERREEFRKGFMEKLDTDKDGKLSDEEKEAAKKQRGERRGRKGKRGGRPMPQADAPTTLEL